MVDAFRERWSDRARRLARFDRPTWRRFFRKLRWPAAAFTLLVLLGVGAFAYLYATVELPDTEPAPSSSRVLDANGIEIATITGKQFRRKVTLDEIAPVVVDALISTEDRRFYDHSGVDGFGVVRAAFNNFRGQDTEGGSTLTQQLVKNAYLTSDRTFRRKAKEAVLAVKLEREMSKDEILTEYLNTVYFGRGAYGIEAAAEVYFDSTAKELELGQAAYLVGALQSPESLDPIEDPGRAEARRDAVLGAMVDNDTITDKEASAVSGKPIETVTPDDPVKLGEGSGAHFVDWVHEQADELIGSGAATSQGLTITTTLDIEDQILAEDSIAKTLDAPEDPEAALVAIDEAGAIKAMVGSRDHEKLEVNLALGAAGGGAGRQPGSTFKPVALMAGLEEGFWIDDDFEAPATISVDTDSGPYEVSNYDKTGEGTIDLAEATVNSVNTVYAQLAVAVGGEALADVAERGGVDAELDPVPSLALGAGEVSPLDMADLYSTFARRGEHIEPFAITKIESTRGDVLYEHETESDEAFDMDNTDALNVVLQGVVAEGTGTAAKIDRPVAGKTGTTDNYGDAWFAGYTPNYTAVVWMGYPEGATKPMTDVKGRSVTGGSFPAQIWHDFASRALSDVEPAEFAPLPDRPDRDKPDDDRSVVVRTGGKTDSPDDSTTTTNRGSTTTTEGDEDEVDVTTTTRKNPSTTNPPTTAPSTTRAPTTTRPPSPTTTAGDRSGAGAGAGGSDRTPGN